MGTDNQGQYLAKAGDFVLDIGCGSGLSLLEATALGAEAFGIEADPNVAPLARDLGLTVHIGNIFDKPFPERRFDLVALNQVIEHVASPEETLLAIRERLSDGGRVVAAFPNQGSFWRRVCGERWLNWHIPFHVNHFNSRSFRLLAERCGYQIFSQRTVTPNVWTLMQLRVWREAPVRGAPSPTWSTAAAGSADPTSRLLRKLRIALLLPLITIVNRTIDACGAGDSLMFELRRAGRP
jgi:SAM-dependent methyltransferase